MNLRVLGASDEELAVELVDLAATVELARRLAKAIRSGNTIGLSGGLGVGKTELVRHVVGALRGVPGASCRDVVSPSFMLEAVYPLPEGGPLAAVHHWDLYRVVGEELPGELDEIIGDKRLLTFVEWHERVPSLSRLLSLELVIAFSGLFPGENGSAKRSKTARKDPIAEGRTCRIRRGAGMRSHASGTDLWDEIRAVLVESGP